MVSAFTSYDKCLHPGHDFDRDALGSLNVSYHPFDLCQSPWALPVGPYPCKIGRDLIDLHRVPLWSYQSLVTHVEVCRLAHASVLGLRCHS